MNALNLPKFNGREIAPEVVKALEVLPRDAEIVTLKAGENMLITCAFVAGDALEQDLVPEYAWTGEKWHEIGYL